MTTWGRIDVAVPAAARLGQTPTWDPATDSLLWVDVLSSAAHRFTPRGEDHAMTLPQQVSAAKPRSHGGLLMHMAEGVALFEANGDERTWLVYWGREGYRGGETAVDAAGRLWATTVRHDEGGGGWLVRIAPDGATRVVLSDVAAGSGLAWSPDWTRMYFADGATRRVDVFDFDLDTGAATARRTFGSVAGADGQPAGMCVDADGCAWVAVRGGGQLRRYTPEGALDRTIPLPVERPTGCCFGGPDLTDLFVTSAREGTTDPGDADGSLLVLPGAGTGLRTCSFAG